MVKLGLIEFRGTENRWILFSIKNMAQIEFNEFDFRKVHPIKLPFAEKYIYDVDNIFMQIQDYWMQDKQICSFKKQEEC